MVVAGVRARMARMVWAKCSRAAIGQIVAIDRGDDDVRKAQLGDRLRHVLGLGRIERLRQPRRHVAEGAGARAGVAHDHHGGVALLPALADVGAGRLLAHRDEAVLAQHARASRRTAREAAGTRTRIQSGLRSTGVSGLFAFSGCRGGRLSMIVTMEAILRPPDVPANGVPWVVPSLWGDQGRAVRRPSRRDEAGKSAPVVNFATGAQAGARNRHAGREESP